MKNISNIRTFFSHINILLFGTGNLIKYRQVSIKSIYKIIKIIKVVVNILVFRTVNFVWVNFYFLKPVSYSSSKKYIGNHSSFIHFEAKL